MSAVSYHAARLYKKQSGICAWCLLPLPPDLTEAEVDHIIPRARGGPNRVWNLQLLHRDCNRGEVGKNAALTAQAVQLAAEHGVILRQRQPSAWAGSQFGHARPVATPVAAKRAEIQSGEGPTPHDVCVWIIDCPFCGDEHWTEPGTGYLLARHHRGRAYEIIGTAPASPVRQIPVAPARSRLRRRDTGAG